MLVSYLVQTPYGKGRVIRHDHEEGRFQIELRMPHTHSNVNTIQSKKEKKPADTDCEYPSKQRVRMLLYTSQCYPSISPSTGSHVVTTCFPKKPLRGRVLSVRPLDRIAVVRLYNNDNPYDHGCLCDNNPDNHNDSPVAAAYNNPNDIITQWLWSSWSRVTCYFSYSSLQVIDGTALAPIVVEIHNDHNPKIVSSSSSSSVLLSTPSTSSSTTPPSSRTSRTSPSLLSTSSSSSSSSVWRSFQRQLLDLEHHKTYGYQLYRSHAWPLASSEFTIAAALIAQLLAVSASSSSSSSSSNTNPSKASQQPLQLLRGNLILTSIKCSHYLAVCALMLHQHTACIKHCMDALTVLKNLEQSKHKHHYKNNKAKKKNSVGVAVTAGEIRVFGCWRIYTLHVLAHVFLEQPHSWAAAHELLGQAHAFAHKYLLPVVQQNPPTKIKARSISVAHEQRLEQLARADRATLRLEAIVLARMQQLSEQQQLQNLPQQLSKEEISVTIITAPSNANAIPQEPSKMWLLEEDERRAEVGEDIEEDEEDALWPSLTFHDTSTTTITNNQLQIAAASKDNKDDDEDFLSWNNNNSNNMIRTPPRSTTYSKKPSSQIDNNCVTARESPDTIVTEPVSPSSYEASTFDDDNNDDDEGKSNSNDDQSHSSFVSATEQTKSMTTEPSLSASGPAPTTPTTVPAITTAFQDLHHLSQSSNSNLSVSVSSASSPCSSPERTPTAAAVAGFVPTDPNVRPRDNKVFEARKSYLASVKVLHAKTSQSFTTNHHRHRHPNRPLPVASSFSMPLQSTATANTTPTTRSTMTTSAPATQPSHAAATTTTTIPPVLYGQVEG